MRILIAKIVLKICGVNTTERTINEVFSDLSLRWGSYPNFIKWIICRAIAG